MPTVTGAVMAQHVRDYADQPDDGQPTKSYITNAMIYSWLSKGYRKALRSMAKAGYPITKTSESFVAPGPSFDLSAPCAAILAVYAETGNTRIRLPRLVDTVEPKVTGGSARYWSASIADDGTVTIGLYPQEDSWTIVVYTIPEPADIGSATSVYLPDAHQDLVELSAAIRCLARSGERNDVIRDLYNEAIADADAEAAHFTSEAVIRNTDDVYPPGYDQGRRIDGNFGALDFTPYIVP